MEKEKSNGLLIIVLALIILCLGGYIVYDKVLNNTSNTSSQNEESNNANNNVSSYSYNLTKRTTIQEVGNGYIRVLVDTDGNAYLHTVGNLDYESDAKIKENVKAIENQFKTYSPKGYNSYGSTELKGLPDISNNKQICVGVESSSTYTVNTQNYEHDVSTKVPLGNYLIGDEYICQVNNSQVQHFVVIGTNGDKVNLLMTSNIDSTFKNEETSKILLGRFHVKKR